MAWDIDDAEYSRALGVYAQTHEGLMLFISPGGTKLYVGAPGDQRIYEYTLSEAHNITTASYDQYKSFISWQYGFWFSPDGARMYVSEENCDKIMQYALGTPWDISTATLVYTWEFCFYEGRHATCLFFNLDGTKLFINDSFDDDILEYALSTPWDLSTASFVKELSLTGQLDYSYGLFFKPDGTKMYVCDGSANRVLQYVLSTPWDIATTTHTQTKGVGSVGGLSFKSDGRRMYIYQSNDDEVHEYDIIASDYYVKKDGNDAFDGKSEANAWLTIDHAQANCGEHNTIHIAEGTYDETGAFVFDPPVGTKFMGAGVALTKLFTSGVCPQGTIAYDDVEIHDCQVGNDPEGMGNGYPLDIAGNNFKLSHVSNRCTLLNITDPITGLDFSNLTGGTGFFCLMNYVSDSTFSGIRVVSGGSLFNIAGDNNVFEDIEFAEANGFSINCPNGSLSRCKTSLLLLNCGSGFTVDDLEVGADGLSISTGDQTITNCKTIGKLSVSAGASAILSWYQQKFYESSNGLSTVIDAAGQTVLAIAGAASNITFTERPFLITTDDDISVLIASWEISGDQNKAWKVTATGVRTVTFQLGDMLPNTIYNLKVGGVKVSSATSDASGVITFSTYTSTFSEKEFTAEKRPPILPPTTLIMTDISLAQYINSQLRKAVAASDLTDYNVTSRSANYGNWIYADRPMIAILLKNKNNFPRVSVESLSQATIEEMGMEDPDHLENATLKIGVWSARDLICTVKSTVNEPLTYDELIDVYRLVNLPASEITAVDDGTTTFIKGTDYQLIDSDSDGFYDSIEWLGEDTPTDGADFYMDYKRVAAGQELVRLIAQDINTYLRTWRGWSEKIILGYQLMSSNPVPYDEPAGVYRHEMVVQFSGINIGETV